MDQSTGHVLLTTSVNNINNEKVVITVAYKTINTVLIVYFNPTFYQ